MNNGDFILPEEEIQYSSEGYEMTTENELDVLEEWVQSHKAVYAYIVDGEETEVLFDARNNQ